MTNYKKCQSGDIQIAYQDRGCGEPLVLIMGLGASSLKWEKHMLEYEKQFRCIAIDNRGAGLSSKPEVDGYAIGEMAEDVIAVMNAEGIASAHLNGISMGGAIAQYLAIHYPERVRSVILTNTFPRCNVSFRRSIEFLRDACGQLDGRSFGRLVQWIVYSFDYQERCEEEMLYEESHDPDVVHPMPSYAYKAQCNAILGFNELERLCQLHAPTLVVAGDSDLFVPLWLIEEMVNAMPNCELFIAKHGGHVQHWEQLEQYNRITLDFLKRHSTQG